MRLAAPLALALVVALPAQADEFTDTLQAALEAYEDGDIQYATEELAYAQQLLSDMKSDSLVEFLPPAPAGWTRSVDTEMTAGLAMMGGGGVGAEATYSDGATRFSVTLLANSPMVTAMAGMFGNPAMMSAAGRIVRVGRQKYLDQDGDMSTMVGNSVLVQASGADPDAMLPILEEIDYRGLSRFGN